ncbi:E3 ubiquitin-protein ligase RNF14-like [Eriocheir sinensis]|uniref:E3 ubiquitin-protein ligase RNF14-like n=1 Tax=Eriocheir sinensis TaxID=95602 RepID=UPI0021C8CB82|nr:E3 ubiquitin-protein ligase RNF14-like [Eriocheir sinensis]XP_050712313.1 E3 ubiquitin-protein ligase RNF14-like [Eriocheir sinensis]XP_050712314.1 E3 ubiquitin-protein ligase RNF14-like [Eriocheir sinensis]
MSLDAEAQEDELLALASIYEESFTASQVEVEGAEAGGGDRAQGGVLAIHLDLPPDFTLLSRLTKDTGEVEEERYQVEYLPPIHLHFTFPATYPSQHPPCFMLSCKWLNRAQLTKLRQKLDSLWEENEGSVITFTWAQFLKEEAMDYLYLTDTLDLDSIKPSCVFPSMPNTCGLVTDVSQEHCGAACDPCGEDCDISDSCTSNSDGATAGMSVVVNGQSGYDSRAVQDIGPKTKVLHLLKEYNEDTRRKVFKSKMFECKVCFLDKLGANCLEFWPCRHVYCKDCMASFFSVQISEGNIKFLRCPEEKCDSEANPKQVQEVVSVDLYNRWDEMLLNSTLSSLGDIQPCPRIHCQYPVAVEERRGQCPSCKFVFCGICCFSWHGVNPCRLRHSESKKIMEIYINGTEDEKKVLENQYGKKYLCGLRDEFLSLCYLEENSKRCPKCLIKIEKRDGCNKMTCQHCSINFCWLCMMILNLRDPYSHFSDRNFPCYNQLFHGAYQDNEDYMSEEEDEV